MLIPSSARQLLFQKSALIRDIATRTLSILVGTEPKPQWRKVLSGGLVWATVVIAAVVGIAWTAFITAVGVELSPDSCFYLKTAASMYYGGNFDTSVTVWPPMYPFLVHLFLYITPWPAVAASMASGIFVVGTLLVAAVLFRRILAVSLGEIFLLLNLVTMSAFWTVFQFAWSENALTFFIALHLMLLHFYHQKRSPWLLVATGISVAAAAMTKYIGAALAVSFSLYIFHSMMKQKTTLMAGVAGLASALIPNLLWAFRNYRIDGSLTGIRAESHSTFWGDLTSVFFVAAFDCSLPLLFLFVLGFIFFVYRAVCHFTQKKDNAAPDSTYEGYLYVLIGVFCISLAYACSTTNINKVGSRFVSPFYMTVFAAAACGMRAILLNKKPILWKTAARAAVVAALIVGTVGSINHIPYQLGKLLDAKGVDNDHLSYGFEKSPTASKLSAYFDKQFQDGEVLLITGICRFAKVGRHLLYGLFMRKTPWGSGLTDIRIENVIRSRDRHSRNYLAQKSEMSLTYSKDGKPRRVVFVNLSTYNSYLQVIRAVDTMLAEKRAKMLLLFFPKYKEKEKKYDFYKEVMNGESKKQLPVGLTLKGTKKLRDLMIYHFEKSLKKP
jgi:hypothetical protein